MLIKSATFVISNNDIKKCPAPVLPEYAFIGRSNVGKSSMINMLTGKKNLAKTSSTPGKTRLINHFLVNDDWYLVDLPGLGFAKISKKEKEHWFKMIQDYLIKRKNLLNTFILVDSRLTPQKTDIDFINFLGEHEIPFSIVFTKADKNTKNELKKNIDQFHKELKKYWDELPIMFTTSSEKKIGKEEILKFIEDTNQIFDTKRL